MKDNLLVIGKGLIGSFYVNLIAFVNLNSLQFLQQTQEYIKIFSQLVILAVTVYSILKTSKKVKK